MSKEEALALMEESQDLIGRTVGGLKISFVNILPMHMHPKSGEMIRHMYEGNDHWTLMGDVADFEVHAFFVRRFLGDPYSFTSVHKARHRADV
ncbi:MAG: hypothetical protein HY842_17065 [Bacteroidetes bacterium]|nr:hypothetical protein [Bacteroidota bacterium]